MGEVIQMADYDFNWDYAEVCCNLCEHWWIAVFHIETPEPFECPRCKRMAGSIFSTSDMLEEEE